MNARPLPAKDKLTLCFAHVAYRMGERFALRNAGLDWFEVRSLDDLKARVSNRSAIGSKVEMRAGSLRHKLETMSTTPAVEPAGVLFGLAARDRADVVRVLWPAGIVQAEVEPPQLRGASTTAAMPITELNRKPSSCPYLFFWNGSRFEFLTDCRTKTAREKTGSASQRRAAT